MEDGRWKMEDGRWKMEDGRWKMEDGRWKMDDCHPPSAICRLSFKSGRPDSNRRRPAWEAGILPTELRPRQTKRTARRSFKTRTWVDQRAKPAVLDAGRAGMHCIGVPIHRSLQRWSRCASE